MPRKLNISPRPCKACSAIFYPNCGVHYFCSPKCLVMFDAVRTVGGCLIGRFNQDRYGYGQLVVPGDLTESGRRRMTTAHKVSYRVNKGEIPDGMCVCHTCDNPPCIEPSHLFLGTHADNKDDCVQKSRQAYGSRNGRAILTEEEALAIFSDTRDSRIIAKEYKIIRGRVYDIKSGKNWGWLTGAAA